MLKPDAVHIWRDPDGDYHVEWDDAHPDLELTVEPLADTEGVETHYHAPEQSRARLRGLSPDDRHYFRLRDQHGNETLASERHFGMEGTPNFRDFGGYHTADGRQVKWGYLYRSGQLSGLSDRDLDLLARLEIDLVCDFRRVEEQEIEPSRLPGERRPRIASLPIIPGSNSRFLEEAEHEMSPGRQAMYDFMLEINRDFAEGQAETYARMFREILDTEDARFLVHCAAGKDRTGFAAALVLLALGVPRDVVLRDYMLTGRYFAPERELARLQRKYNMEHMDADSILPMLEVHEAYLQRGLQAIDDNYDRVEDYLADVLGVGPAELAELRGRYLAD